MDDKGLHRTFVKLGHDRRKLTNQLLAILPEIFTRKIYLKYARTIEEYAGKFGGLSKEVVKKRLRIEKYIYNKPKLKEAILTEGIHKVALVASLATVEDEAIWADKIQNMSKPAVQELTKEVRYKIEKGEIRLNEIMNMNLFECHDRKASDGRPHDDQVEGATCKTTLCSAAPQRIRIDLEGELFFLFLKLKKKYGKKLTNREVMKKIFEENLGRNFPREFRDADEKIEEREEAENEKNTQYQSVKVIPGDGNSRYISIHIRRNLLQKTAGKCSYPDCQRPAQVFHHTDRFASNHSHKSLKPICKIHHEFAHNGLIQNEKQEVQGWQLQLQNGEPDKIDRLYREYRKMIW